MSVTTSKRFADAVPFKLNPSQQEALNKVAAWLHLPHSQVFSLGGMAGTGKSSIIPFILDAAIAANLHVRIAAPTGKAASVINRKLGCKIATTIHAFAYRPIGNKKTERLDPFGRPIENPEFQEHPFSADLIIVDEASMIADRIHERLRASGAQILYVGDYGQLPPVGQDDISIAMRDLDARLEKIERNSGVIVEMAYHVRNGGNLCDEFDGVNHYDAFSADATAEILRDIEATMVICAMNKTRVALNQSIRKLQGFSRPHFEEGETIVICSNNNAMKCYNGELWQVEHIHYVDDHKEGKIVRAAISNRDTGADIHAIDLGMDWRQSQAFDEMITSASYGYALTCHKCQGSESPHVAVLAEWIGFMKAHQHAWKYTACTRAQDRLSILHPTDWRHN